jgi:hypothetical protein
MHRLQEQLAHRTLALTSHSTAAQCQGSHLTSCVTMSLAIAGLGAGLLKGKYGSPEASPHGVLYRGGHQPCLSQEWMETNTALEIHCLLSCDASLEIQTSLEIHSLLYI